MNLVEQVIGWVAPPICLSCGSEGSVLCEACSTSEIISYGEHCWSCGALSDGGRTCSKCARSSSPRFVWISTNYEGVAKELVQTYKFGELRLASEPISRLMLETLDDFDVTKSLRAMNYLIAPIPTATSRRRARGFDHSELLAKKLGRKLNLKAVSALARLGQTRQLGSRRDIRLKQAEDKYYVRLPEMVKGRNVLLIDDVVTTGATIRAATKTLRRAGAKRVDALIFAKKI